MSSDSQPGGPAPGEWFRVWLRIGLQSFGGGVTTISLIRQELVERGKWVTPDEYVRDFALCQLAPGVNILGIAVIFGRRLGGRFGIPLALAGLLLPSATVTACITAGYVQVKSTTAVVAALRGVMPAVAGLGIATALQTSQAPLRGSREEGFPSTLVALLLVAIPAVAVLHWNVPTVYVLLIASLLGALCVYGERRIWKAKP